MKKVTLWHQDNDRAYAVEAWVVGESDVPADTLYYVDMPPGGVAHRVLLQAKHLKAHHLFHDEAAAVDAALAYIENAHVALDISRESLLWHTRQQPTQIARGKETTDG